MARRVHREEETSLVARLARGRPAGLDPVTHRRGAAVLQHRRDARLEPIASVVRGTPRHGPDGDERRDPPHAESLGAGSATRLRRINWPCDAGRTLRGPGMETAIGIDVGSTTAKAVVIAGGRVVWSSCERHAGAPRPVAARLVARARAAAPAGAPLGITGSAGLVLPEAGA